MHKSWIVTTKLVPLANALTTSRLRVVTWKKNGNKTKKRINKVKEKILVHQYSI